MRRQLFQKAAALAILCSVVAGPVAYAQITNPPALTAADPGGKTIILPARIDRVPVGNDYNNPDSEYSYSRSKTTKNFVLFWDKEYGNDPMTNTDPRRRFDVDGILKEADRFFDYYVNDLKWVDKDKSYASKYKFLFFVIPNPANGAGTAFGGSTGDGKIGSFWSPAARINRGPYGVVAHELGHSFQAILRLDYNAAPLAGGSVVPEMTSQWMLWQVYPEWMTFENYHLTAFMQATHLAFLHPDNQYHSAQVFEYWSEKHGIEIIGKLWREAHRGEDPVMAYKRITGITQHQFNDEIFDAARHFVTWDMPRIEKVAARYANQHTTSILPPVDGWYQIPSNKCPQNYGYNAIQLQVPAAETKVTLDFKGMTNVEGYHIVHPDYAGWRYGFLASLADGSRVYGSTNSNPEGTTEFTVPANTKFLWLVVTGAPTEHWVHVTAPRGAGAGGRGRGGRGRRGGDTNAVAIAGATNTATIARTGTETGATNTPAPPPAISYSNEQWPYAFKLAGTKPIDSIIH